VQDYLLKASKEIFRQLMHENGHFYVCGDVSMAEDVGKALKVILKDNGVDDPESVISNLKVSIFCCI